MISARGTLHLLGLIQSSSWPSFVLGPSRSGESGIDIISPLLTAPGGLKFAVVVVDYFTKWADAIPLLTITEKNLTKFIREYIIYKFGIPHSLVSNNTLQFDNQAVRNLCDQFGIK